MSSSSQPSQRSHTRRRRRSAGHPQQGGAQVDRWQVVLDVLLIAILGFAPLLFGGRYAGGKFAMIALVAVAVSVWALRLVFDRTQRWHGSHALWLVAAGVLLLGLQMMPQGQSTANAANLLPTWSSGAVTGQWNQASFLPAGTRGGMVMLLACGGLFWITIQRLRTIDDVQWMLKVIGWIVLAVAGFGLVQYLTSNGLFCWFYEHPWRNTSDVVKGPFDNRNHFAHFLALGCGPLMWWWLHNSNKHRSDQTKSPSPSRKNTTTFVGALAMGVVLFAALMTFSRAGCLLILLVVAIATIAYFRLGWISKQLAAALLGVALLVMAALWIHGHDRLADRLDDYAGTSLESLDGNQVRRKIWAANIEGIRNNGLLGAGVGSHRHLYPVYLKESPLVEYTHAESGYLQVLLETGWLGLALLLGGIAVMSHWIMTALKVGTATSQSRKIYACAVPVVAGLIVSVLHSFVDFVWYITACVSLTVVLAACAFRLYQLACEQKPQRESGIDLSIWSRCSVATLTILIGSWMVYNSAGPAIASPAWDAYLCSQRDQHDVVPTEKDQSLDASIAALEKVVHWHPGSARANLRLAGVYLQKFQQIQNLSDNALEISQLREAVIRSDFKSIAQQQLATHDPGSSNALKVSELAHALRDEWFERTMQFDVLAAERIREFDTDADEVLVDAEIIAAKKAINVLANTTPDGSGRLTAEKIATAYRANYRHTHRYLYLALEHVRRGLAACPLQGEGYLLLAELCFLDEKIVTQADFARQKRELMNQALRLRPWDGDVLLVAGKEALLANHLDLATKMWRRAFQSGPAHRQRLIDVFVQQQIPLDFVAQHFAPVLDGTACEMLVQKYQAAGIDIHAERFFQHMASTATKEAHAAGPTAVKKWLLAYKAYERLGNRDAQIDCAKKASTCLPNDLRTRRRLATVLMEMQLYAEAEPHVHWCLRRQPGDRYLRKAVATILAQSRESGKNIELVSGESEVRVEGSR